jgi:hypothetical protein
MGQYGFGAPVHVSFEDWTQRRSVASWGTNTGAKELPVQRWRHFKEAFPPELVARAVTTNCKPVNRCLDPFGGSGTTALACQFLGVHPVTVEVNRFLADLIEAKLVSYDADAVARDFGRVVRAAARMNSNTKGAFAQVPATFIEPGVNGRWIFDKAIATHLAAHLDAIDRLQEEKHRRLFRVLLGSILIDVSNVVVNGKGRRYRRGWEQRRRSVSSVGELFRDAVHRAIGEIHRYARRVCPAYEILRGDCRFELEGMDRCELAVFSPPYPNSFDYTDVYNIELWMLGYLTNSRSNQALRGSTLCSHVQVARDFPAPPSGSKTLNKALRALVRRRHDLWDRRIPDMVGGYFADMMSVLDRLRSCIVSRGLVWMIVGDSRYADVSIDTANIIVDLASSAGWTLRNLEPCRSMRTSAQQGGGFELAETLIVLSRN